MADFEEFPYTVIEIIGSLYFSGKMLSSGDLQNILAKRGMELETRTIRYHLTNLEKRGLVRRFGNKGVALTGRGIEDAKMLLVFDRIGGLSMETEKLSLECDYTPARKTGTIMVNTLLLDEDARGCALAMLSRAARSNVIISPLIGVLEAGERLWNYEIPPGKIAVVGVSSRNYDILLQQSRIPTETTATFLYRIENNEPKGIADIISHTGTTLSPGELLIRGKYTSVSSVLETGSGLVTAAIKSFPSIYYDEVADIIDSLDKNLFSGVMELKAQMLPMYRMSYKDRERGYILVYGGSNFFAPLVEQNVTEHLSTSHSLYATSKMMHVEHYITST